MPKSIANGVQAITSASTIAAHDLDVSSEASEIADANILYRTKKKVRQSLRQIALDEESSMQALLTEAINPLLIDQRALIPVVRQIFAKSRKRTLPHDPSHRLA